MNSMTGYGRCRVEKDGRVMTMELKSVNHRFLDLSLRMPRSLGFLEDDLRKGIARRLHRGHVDVFITYENHRADAKEVTVDVALLGAYKTAMQTISGEIKAPAAEDAFAYARLPDVLCVAEREEDREAIIALMEEALDNALGELCTMRAREGERLAGDMREKIATLSTLREEIALRSPLVVDEYREKLAARMEQLLSSPMDEQRLAQEVAIFADRASIDEELVRLLSHFDQINKALSVHEPVGRRLDFLVQELNREMNTIGSKASDMEITRRVVDAKAEIEKLREQVQNIE